MHWQRITETESELRQRQNRRKNTCSLWASQWFNHESQGMTKTTSPYSELISDRCEKMVTARLESPLQAANGLMQPSPKTPR